MCGICGWIGTRPSERSCEIERMVASLRSRGPDDCGVWRAEGGRAVLGHTRLSIIDVAASTQPMTNEDGTVVVTYNGEIYNFAELRRYLLSRGHVFRTRGDTEVLVHLYEEHGAGMLERLDGMFALGLYDARSHTLLLARDRVGIKPLCYWHDPASGELLFGSHLTSILATSVPRRLNRRALAQYLHFGYVIHPESWVEQVRQVEPGEAVQWSNGVVKRSSFHVWRYEPRDELRSMTAAREELEVRLAKSVNAHLVSDVPLGSFLSGGLDSATITGMAQRGRQAEDRVRSFTVRFADQTINEAPRAARVARDIGSQHTEIDAGDLHFDRALLERLLLELGEPFGDVSALAVFILCREARTQVKVALSGDGGDELFLGYAGLRKQRFARRLRVPPRALRAAAAGWLAGSRRNLPRRAHKYLGLSCLDDPAIIIEWARRYDAESLDAILDRAVFPELFPGAIEPFPEVRARIGGGETGGFLEQQLRFHMLVDLPCDCLAKVDRMAMAHGLEVRVPMLSNDMLEYASEVPLSLGASAPRTKEPLRSLAEALAPTLREPSPKMGFAFPLDMWVRPRLTTYWREWGASRILESAGFDARGLDQMAAAYDRCSVGGVQSYDTRVLSSRLYDLLQLALWMDMHQISV